MTLSSEGWGFLISHLLLSPWVGKAPQDMGILSKANKLTNNQLSLYTVSVKSTPL